MRFHSNTYIQTYTHTYIHIQHTYIHIVYVAQLGHISRDLFSAREMAVLVCSSCHATTHHYDGTHLNKGNPIPLDALALVSRRKPGVGRCL